MIQGLFVLNHQMGPSCRFFCYQCAKTQVRVTADSKGDGQWRDDDSSVFEMTLAQRLQGEYQVTHG
ncbi:hypothetical protein Hanom_Chr16g01478081 [Helianthus anomalus]